MKIYTGPIERKIVALQVHNAFVKQILIFRHIGLSATTQRKYLKKELNLAMRHHKPVAGVAPFVTCHKCSKLQQQPADFSFIKGGWNSTSLKSRSHLVPFSLNTIGLPSGELRHQNLMSTITTIHLQNPSYILMTMGFLAFKAFSLELDPIFLTQPFHPLNGCEHVNTDVSPSSTFKGSIVASRYFFLVPSQLQWRQMNKLYFPQICLNLGNCQHKRRQRPALICTLHKLMGYSTPSQVIREASFEGK